MCEHVPTSIEQQAESEDLKIIRVVELRAQTIVINSLPAFDNYFRWYYPIKKVIAFKVSRLWSLSVSSEP